MGILIDQGLFAATAAVYALLLLLLLSSGDSSRIRRLLIGACAATAASEAAMAAGWVDPFGPSGAIVELTGPGSWCAFTLYLLHKRGQSEARGLRLFPVSGLIITIVTLASAFFIQRPLYSGLPLPVSAVVALYARIALSVYGILLIENFFRNTPPESRWHVKLLCLGVGGVFAYGILVYADALLYQRLSLILWDGRAIALIIAAPLIAVSAARNRDWSIDIHVSRTVIFHTATLIGSGIFLLALALTGEIVRTIGTGWGDLIELSLIIGGLASLGVFLSSGSARSRLRRFLAENFFSHRYDYRLEWLKSIDILSANPNPVTVQKRVVSAVAEVADSPAGALWVRDVDGAVFHWAGSWNCPAIGGSEPAGSAFVELFRGGDWVIDLADTRERPEWLAQIPNAWLAVPLTQRTELIGFVVLTRPRAPSTLDRETIDLLRIVGRQAAAHVGEQRYAQALAEGRELHNYGKRFAFVVHDMKNIVGQLSMILQNARYHEGNPEFHRDVLATVRATLDRMNALMGRLRPRQDALKKGLLVPLDVIREVLTTIRRSRGISIGLEHDDVASTVVIDVDAFRSVILHLCDNAVDVASEVKVRVLHEGMRLRIDIVDNGKGMTAEFIRDKLFQPFGSTKDSGFGIGAYQARELIRAAGGDLFVVSKVGGGTIMSVMLPCTASGGPATSIRDLEAAG